MMRFVKSCGLLAGVLLLLQVQFVSAAVSDGVWYDADRMAVAIDLGHPSWERFGEMNLDFDADRTWGQIIDGGRFIYLDGAISRVFSFGVYRKTSFPDGTLYEFGWSPSELYEREACLDWVAYAPTLYYGEPTPEGLHCFTDRWQPAIGEKTIYCRMLDSAGNSRPVLPEELNNVYVAFGPRDWIPLPLYTAPAPDVTVDMDIVPNTLSADSQGNYVTVKIDLPANIQLDAIDLNMLRINLMLNNGVYLPEFSFSRPLKWTGLESGTKNGLQQLTFKLSRSEFSNLPIGYNYKIGVTVPYDNGGLLLAFGQMFIR